MTLSEYQTFYTHYCADETFITVHYNRTNSLYHFTVLNELLPAYALAKLG